MTYTCPVCKYPNLRKPPKDFLICPSCGTEFGYSDSAISHAELRRRWVAQGARWSSTVIPQPKWWNGYQQLLLAAGFAGAASALTFRFESEPNFTATTIEHVGARTIELCPAA